MLSHIYLVRHGETEWSLSGHYTGRTDLPLTTHGESMARAVGVRLRDIEFVRVLSSPLQRALRTCQLAGLKVKTEIEPELVEWNYGAYEGQPSADVQELNPDWNLFHDGCPQGEAPLVVSGRADRLIAKLRTMAGNVALFTHGHFGRALGARWVGLPIAEARHFLFGTAAVSILSYEHDRAGSPAIALWNSSHGELPGGITQPTSTKVTPL